MKLPDVRFPGRDDRRALNGRTDSAAGRADSWTQAAATQSDPGAVNTEVACSAEVPQPRRRTTLESIIADKLLTPGEVAATFRVDPKTVTRWAAAGRISSIRTPGGHRRFRESEIRALLEGPAEAEGVPA